MAATDRPRCRRRRCYQEFTPLQIRLPNQLPYAGSRSG